MLTKIDGVDNCHPTTLFPENKGEKCDRPYDARQEIIKGSPELFRKNGKPKHISRRKFVRPNGQRVEVHGLRKPTHVRFWWSDSGIEEGSIEYLRALVAARVVSDDKMRRGLNYFFDRMMLSVRSRAGLRKIPCSIDQEWLWERYLDQGGKCALSRLPLSISRRQKALLLSLDQIKPGAGYTPDNVRLVCFAVNLGLNQFGDELYVRICKAVAHASRHIE